MNRNLFLSSLLAVALLGATSQARAATVPVVSVDDDSAYAAGTKAMDERRWSDAIVSFDQVINAKGKKADAALYWKAYAQNKLGSEQNAGETCRQLRAQYKDSSWNEDCRALSVSMRVDRTQAARAVGRVDMPLNVNVDLTGSTHGREKDPDAEIKMLALNSVMRQNPAAALPVLRTILSSDQPKSLKQHALFILVQNKSPEADGLLHDLVLGKMGPELQLESIQSSGIYRGKPANDTLAEVYRTTSDVKVKRAVISAFFVSSDDAHLVEIARPEKDIELKRSIVSQLALMHGKAAQDYMLELLK